MSNAAASAAESSRARLGSATSSPRSGTLGLRGRRKSPLAVRGDTKGSLQIPEQLAERCTRGFGERPQDMRNYPCFLECGGELGPPVRRADQRDAELLEAEQSRRLAPQGAVGLELPRENAKRL